MKDWKYCNTCGTLTLHANYSCMPCRNAKTREKRRHQRRKQQQQPSNDVPRKFCSRCDKMQPVISQGRCRVCYNNDARERYLAKKPPPPPTDAELLQVMLAKIKASNMCVYCNAKPRKYGINPKTGKPFKSCSRECADAAKTK